MGTDEDVDKPKEDRTVRDTTLVKSRYELTSAVLQAAAAVLYTIGSLLALMTVVPLTSTAGIVLIILIPAVSIIIAVSIRRTLRIAELGIEKERRSLTSMISLLRFMNVFDSVEYFLDRAGEDKRKSDLVAAESHLKSALKGFYACRTYLKLLKEVRYHALLLDKEPLANQLLKEEREGRRRMEELGKRMKRLEN